MAGGARLAHAGLERVGSLPGGDAKQELRGPGYVPPQERTARGGWFRAKYPESPPPGGASHRRCGCAVAKRPHGRDIVAALLGLFWRLLREGRLKVARGRSWQPEIGMEHASRGRRSGNKGVGARWRGRFRIFSARHCSRTKVSHAENSGMTMLFFSWRLLQCRRGILSHPQERPATHAAAGAAARGALIFCFVAGRCCRLF